MKLALTLSDADRLLPSQALAMKAEDALRKAMEQVEPGLSGHLHSHEGEASGTGGECRSVLDLGDWMSKAYDRRCAKMLEDLAQFLVKDPK